MTRFNRLPLRHKLTLLSLVTATVAMLLTCAGFVGSALVAFKTDLVNEAATAAEMIGYNSAAALSFNDAHSAGETLAALSAQSEILMACIYDKEGRVFATYPHLQPASSFGPALATATERFGSDRLELYRPIRVQGEEIGSIYLRSDFRGIRERLYRLAWIIAVVAAVVIFVAYFLASRLQRLISSPISDLAAIVGRVTAEKNYSIRAVKRGADELGRLIDGFNDMLGQIQARDSALQSANDSLEHHVEERTAKLAEASGLLEAMLANSPDLIYFKDRESRFVRFSQACMNSLGLSEPGQLRGKTDFDFCAAGDAQLLFADEQEIIRTGQPIIGKLEQVNYADGRVIWMLTAKMPWLDGTGAIVGTFGISKDVTALKDTEGKLAYERDQLRALLDSSPDTIYFKDTQSRFVLVSRSKVQNAIARVPDLRARRVARGLPAEVAESEMLTGLTDFDTFRDEAARLAYEDEQQIIRSGDALIGKLERQEFLDASVCWSLSSKMPWHGHDGKIIGTFGISKDVTDLKVAEEKLNRLQRDHEQILNAIGEGIHWINCDGQIIFENPAGARLLGWEMSELHGRPAHATMHHSRADGSSYPQAESPIYATLKTGDSRRVDNEVFWRKDGTSIPVEYMTTPMRDETGKIIGAAVVFKDITERKRAEAELVALHRQLMESSRQAGMAEVATGVLHNVGNVLNSVNVSATLVSDQVRHSKSGNVAKLATLFVQNKTNLGDFLTNDTRGRMIPDYLGTLAEDLAGETKTIVTELEHLRKNVEHIKDIVAMQQSYARTSGVFETLSVPDMIEDALRMNAGSLARHDVQATRDYRARPVVTTDKHKVMQILINLVRNAKYACDESGRTDKKIIVRIEADEQCVKISVIDNGVGIPAANLARVFSHGFTTRKAGHGFGLHSGALAAKEIGGTLNVESEGPGRGAMFVLTLPYVAKGVAS